MIDGSSIKVNLNEVLKCDAHKKLPVKTLYQDHYVLLPQKIKNNKDDINKNDESLIMCTDLDVISNKVFEECSEFKENVYQKGVKIDCKDFFEDIVVNNDGGEMPHVHDDYLIVRDENIHFKNFNGGGDVCKDQKTKKSKSTEQKKPKD